MPNEAKCAELPKLRDALSQLAGEDDRSERNLRLRDAVKQLTIEDEHSERCLETTIRHCALAGVLILAVAVLSLWTIDFGGSLAISLDEWLRSSFGLFF